MQICLIKNTSKILNTANISKISNISNVLYKNKTFRFNFLDKNFSFYKLQNKKFCDPKSLTNITEPKKEEFSIDDIDQITTIKHVTLNNYLNDLRSLDNINNQEKTNLPIKVEKIGNEEIEIFVPDKTLSRAENFQNYKQFLERKELYEKEYLHHKMKIGVALFLLFLGLFSLWIPLYKTICETQGFAIKTYHTDYKFDGKKCNLNLT